MEYSFEETLQKAASFTPPQTGPEAIKYALENIDLDEVEKNARETLKNGKRTKRSVAVQTLRIVEGMRRNGQTPSDYMISKVPVIPPQFRPFAAAGGTFIPGDANILYKDFFDLRDAHEEERKMFGDENAGRSRLDLYDGVRSVYGYGEAVKAKTKAKEVKGFLEKLTGATSKFSYFQRRLLSKNQDNTGRSTIIAAPELGIDEIGIPKDMAFTMYAPYIQRRLKQSGMRDAEALKHVKERTPEALRALEKEVEVRPVMYSRAPAWHKHSIVAGKPKLIDGDAIATNVYVMGGMSGDFDGNCIIGNSKLLVQLPASKPTPRLPATHDLDATSIKITLDNQPEVECAAGVMINKHPKILSCDVEHVVVEMKIEDFPHLPSTARKDKNGATVYDVPAGVKVQTTSPDGKGARWAEVTTFTVEDGCKLKHVITNRRKEVTCSENESLAVFCPVNGIKRIAPAQALGEAVPVIQKFANSQGGIGDKEFGWFLGAFLSDGTFDGHMVTYSKALPAMREKFLQCLAHITGNPKIVTAAKTYREMHEAETNCGISGNSVKLHVNGSMIPQDVKTTLRSCYSPVPEGARSCIGKKFPSSVWSYSRECQLGILSGLIDGDGSVSVSKSRKKPQVLINFCTSSPQLRDGVLMLCKFLGIGCSYSETYPSEGRVQKHTSYTLSLSSEGINELLPELDLVNKYEGLDILRSEGVKQSPFNVTPVVYEAFTLLEKYYPAAKAGVAKHAWAADKRKAKPKGYSLFARSKAQFYAKAVIEHVPDWQELAGLAAFVHAAFDMTTWWERVAEVEDAPTERVYDIGVPSTKVFALSSGLVVYDTINVHVPSSDAAVKEAYERMMPSTTPFSDRIPDKIVPLPKQEQILGLFTAASAPPTQPVVFNTKAEAEHSIRSGKVKLSQDIKILEMPDL